MALGGFTRPPTRTGAPFEGGSGATGLAPVFNTPPITPPSTPPICPPGTPPGTPPATPSKASVSGASLISAIVFGITVGAKSLPELINFCRGAALTSAVVAGGGGGGGGGGATSIIAAYCLMLMVSVKNSPSR